MNPKPETYYIFTDGACSNNPGKGGYGAIIYAPNKTVVELGKAFMSTTNNRMEMTAILDSLVCLSEVKDNIHVYTDSMYFINGITKWIFSWKQKSWKTSTGKEVLNKDLWMSVDTILDKMNSRVSWFYVPGHSDFLPNERVDQIAVSYSKNGDCDLYEGSYSSYDVDLFKDIELVESGKYLKKDSSKNSVSKKNRSNKKAFSYISVVDGKLSINKTWSECEALVKGRSGAKFKKSLSYEEELLIAEEFKKYIK